jgi:hypothetical protein
MPKGKVAAVGTSLRKHFQALIASALTTVCSILSAAPVLQVNGSGILTGASGVDVLGSFYDVTFVDGSCFQLFSGCNATSDLPFQSLAAGSAAGQALLNTVLVDSVLGQFDSRPELTMGCISVVSCDILIPYGINPGNAFASATVQNLVLDSLDFVLITAYGNSFNTQGIGGPGRSTFAVFTPAAAVPEPGTLLLAAVALSAMGFIGKRRTAHLLAATQ